MTRAPTTGDTPRQRSKLDSEDISPDSTIALVSRKWYEDEIDGQRAANTLSMYRHVVNDIIVQGLGGVRLGEINVARVDRFVKAVASSRGAGAAKSTRSVLSGVLGYAARLGALHRNPVRDISPIKKPPRKAVVALSLEELLDIRSKLHSNELALLRDLVEPIDFMLGTGVRIGEALAIRWADLSLDTDPRTVLIRSTIAAGKLQETTKTASSRRRLTLPEWLADSLQRRRDTAPENPLGLVFASERGTIRDPPTYVDNGATSEMRPVISGSSHTRSVNLSPH